MLCIDDDVVCEPESILRAVTFGDLARRPTIVGGHMFSLFAKARLHSFGEIINRYRFWWMSPPVGRERLGLRRPQPAQLAVAAPPHRRGLQRLVHVPDPHRGARARSGSACRCSSSGTTRSSASAPQAAGYPTVTLPGRRGLARAVDRQERRPRLAGLLPPAQPASSRRCCTRPTSTAGG